MVLFSVTFLASLTKNNAEKSTFVIPSLILISLTFLATDSLNSSIFNVPLPEIVSTPFELSFHFAFFPHLPLVGDLAEEETTFVTFALAVTGTTHTTLSSVITARTKAIILLVFFIFIILSCIKKYPFIYNTYQMYKRLHNFENFFCKKKLHQRQSKKL